MRDTLTCMIDYEEGIKLYELTVKVTGKVAGIPFEGSDTIAVIRKQKSQKLESIHHSIIFLNQELESQAWTSVKATSSS